MKSSRTVMIAITAVVLMAIVMAVAAFFTISGMAQRARYAANAVWSAPASAALSVNITDLTGDGERDVFAQDANGVKLLDAQGQVILDKPLPQPLATTLGDVNGDGVPDIIAYSWNGERGQVMAFTGQDQLLWERDVPDNMSWAGRATALDFENDGRSEVVIGDYSGALVALSSQGEELWQYSLPEGYILRGLDEVALPEGDLIAAGDELGPVVVLDRQGQVRWQTEASSGLRRLRAFPMGGPLEGRVFVGGVDGKLVVHRGDNGEALWEARVGQEVNEIRPAELDGDPATTEVVVGGKDGGIWAFSQAGQQLWRASVGEKVNEIARLNTAGLNLEGLSSDVVIAGVDDGNVYLFDASGRQLMSFSGRGSIGRVEVGKLAETAGFIIADSSQLAMRGLSQEAAPFWYTPIVGGLLACVVIAIVAVIAASMKPAPTLQVSAEAMTVEAQKARRRMLFESIADLDKIRGQGEVPEQAYLARMQELRQQLARVNEALLKLGEPIKAESLACPHCGGSLSLGTDRCEFCGQVVLV